MPSYQEPEIDLANNYGLEELKLRLSQWQNAVLARVTEITGQNDNAVTVKNEVPINETVEVPGDTTIRTITYSGKGVDVPYFLRDAFLLPQRFPNSERFMIALGGAQQARIMSEFPTDLEGISNRVKRYNETHDALLYQELVILAKYDRVGINTVSKLFEQMVLLQKIDE